jgi:hypothetical protein
MAGTGHAKGSTAILISNYQGVEFRHLRDNPMNPAEFQDKWRAEPTDRSAATRLLYFFAR